MLHFELQWENKLARGDINDVTLGVLNVTLGKTVVWQNFRWSWHDLLDYLCINWNKIQNEGAVSATASDSLKYDFQISHDLAYAPRGGSPPPSIIFTRKGLMVEIATGAEAHLCGLNQTMNSLKLVGNIIAKRLLAIKTDPKAEKLLTKWKSLTGFREEIPSPPPAVTKALVSTHRHTSPAARVLRQRRAPIAKKES